MAGQPTTYLRADRLPWTQAPAEVRDWVAARAGEPIAGWSDRSGGMSTGLATVVHGSRRSVFVKAVDADHNPRGADFYRREAEFAARLASLPSVPTPLDAGELTTAQGVDWVLLLFDALPGEPPPHPWRPEHLVRTLDAWVEVREALTTIDDLPNRGMLAGLFDGWRQLAEDPDSPWHQFAGAWAEREVGLLDRIESETDRIAAHLDLRADNILIGTDQVWFVDWAHPSVAAPWVDPALLFCDVISSGADSGDGGGIDVVSLWRDHPACRGGSVQDLIDTVSCYAAFMITHGSRPADSAVPHGRAWQRLVGERAMPFALRHG